MALHCVRRWCEDDVSAIMAGVTKPTRISEYPFEEERFSESGRVFPVEIDDDPWMLFHGTSSAYESAIESDGLSGGAGPFGEAAISLVTGVFERLGWFPWNAGGYAPLKSFSQGFDLMGGPGLTERRSPLFLAETSHQAALYASDDFLGGEKVRGIRNAIEDARRVLFEPEATAQFLGEYGVDRQARLGDSWGFDSGDEAIAWLSDQWEALTAFQPEIQAVRGDGMTGIVYAVKVPRHEITRLAYSGTMGVMAEDVLPPAWVVAKSRIPRSLVVSPDRDLMDPVLWARQDGVLGALTGGSSPRTSGLRKIQSCEWTSGDTLEIVAKGTPIWIPEELHDALAELTFTPVIDGAQVAIEVSMDEYGRFDFFELHLAKLFPAGAVHRFRFSVIRQEVTIEAVGE
jgi:hypothetical protein